MTTRLFAYRHGEERGIACQAEGQDDARVISADPDLGALLSGLAAGRIPLPSDRIVPAGHRVELPVARPARILGVGRNYAEHAAEMGAPTTADRGDEPIFFGKLAGCLIPSGADLVIPAHLASSRVDHEAELALVIGVAGSRIPESRALSHIAGYTLANDVTARDLQARAKKGGLPWLWAKGQRGFCPLGPALVPAAAVDPHALELSCRVDGELRQHASTADMSWSVAELVSIASRHTELEPGDLILTGTPAGVGPLVPGNLVEIEIPQIGVLHNRVVAG